MSAIEKTIEKLITIPADFRWSDLVKVFRHFGYEIDQSGGGSHCRFVNDATGDIFRAYRPHGAKAAVKKYVLREAVEYLREKGRIP